MRSVYICVPREGKSKEEIAVICEKAKKILNPNLTVINNISLDECREAMIRSTATDEELERYMPIMGLAKDLEKIAIATDVLLAEGWEDDFGCMIEKQIAEYYDKGIIKYEPTFNDILDKNSEND